MTNHPTATGARPTIAALNECFQIDHDGSLIWKTRPTNHFLRPGFAARINREYAGHVAGCIGKDGYLLVRLSIQGKSWLIPNHQVVWVMTRGEWPSSELDHRDNCRDNNHPDNLRLAERPQNMANMRVHRDNKLGLKGVHFHRSTGKYRAKICHNRCIISLGLYETAEAAHAAYLAKAKELHGEFARGK